MAEIKKYLGKKAVVTGGTHGMGRAVVDKLVEGGAEVVLTGGRIELAEGIKAHAIRSDAASLDDIAKLRTEVAQRFQDIDLLFINVGYATLREHQEVTPDDYDRTFDVNTKGAFFTAQQLAPLVKEGGSIVFTTSIAQTAQRSWVSTRSASRSARASASSR